MNTTGEAALTPREVLSELDRYIVGQDAAKKAVAVALRNRWRRRRVEGPLKDEITPKNILMIGPTGVGKTEIARAPFVKVEASKYTEVGYVGRDVEGMVRDLTEIGVNLVKAEEAEKVAAQARANALERVVPLVMAGKPDLVTRGRDEVRRAIVGGELNDEPLEIEATESQVPLMSVFSNAGM